MKRSDIVDARQAGLTSGQGRGVPSTLNTQDYNRFDRSQFNAQGNRFAEISPFYAKKHISGDKLPLVSEHDLRTFTLNSQFLGDIYLNKGFFSVPLQAIYHNTFYPWFENPPRGTSDIPDSLLPGFRLSYLRGNEPTSLYNRLFDTSHLSASSSDAFSVRWINSLFLSMQIFSRDGLLQKLGYSIKSGYTETMFRWLFSFHHNQASVKLNVGLTINGSEYIMDFYNRKLGQRFLSFAEFRNLLFDVYNNKYEIRSIYTDFETDQSMHDDFFSALLEFPSFQPDEYVNLEKVIAYQYVCSQFYSNGFVDDIFSARQWEENIKNIVFAVKKSTTNASLRIADTSASYNGVRYEFDLVSRGFCQLLYYAFTDALSATIADDFNQLVLCIRNIFEVHYSLRGSDYFIDSRTQPLAVGDVTIQVNNNSVNALDVNKKNWVLRFLNAAVRVRPHIENYLRTFFGFTPTTKEPKPFYLVKERYLIGKQEVENTANEQGNVVTLLRSAGTKKHYEVFLSEPSIIIGVSSFSMSYFHTQSMDKEFIEFDRFENFNPFFQHIGDQPLLLRELNNDPSVTLNSVFAYQDRYYQYKKSINIASGPFASGSLKSWIPIFEHLYQYSDMRVLDSEFIRNHNSDIDEFYSSLTGETPCDYYHFIVIFKTYNYVASKQQKYPSLV